MIDAFKSLIFRPVVSIYCPCLSTFSLYLGIFFFCLLLSIKCSGFLHFLEHRPNIEISNWSLLPYKQRAGFFSRASTWLSFSELNLKAPRVTCYSNSPYQDSLTGSLQLVNVQLHPSIFHMQILTVQLNVPATLVHKTRSLMLLILQANCSSVSTC